MSPSPWFSIFLVAGLIGALIAVRRAWHRKHSPHPLVRKLTHVGTGLVTLSLPFLFYSVWPVVFLPGLSIIAIIALRLVASLKQEFGSVLHGVERSTGGEIYSPLSVAILFVLAKGNSLLFIIPIPILILTFADAAASLTGGRYGITHYDARDRDKSAEGSVAFFVVASLSTHIPLLLRTDRGRTKTLLIGLTIGLVAMLFALLVNFAS